jgi:hypothetical protein
MNQPADDLDTLLREHFANARPPLAAQRFVEQTLERIAVARRRATWIRRLTQAAALAALILVSPWLIRGSTLLSENLDVWLTVGTQWLLTPAGTALVVGCAGLAALGAMVRRWR